MTVASSSSGRSTWRIEAGVYAGSTAHIWRDPADLATWHISLVQRAEQYNSWDIFCDNLEQLVYWLSNSDLQYPGFSLLEGMLLDTWITWPAIGMTFTFSEHSSEAGHVHVRPGSEFGEWTFSWNDGKPLAATDREFRNLCGQSGTWSM